MKKKLFKSLEEKSQVLTKIFQQKFLKISENLHDKLPEEKEQIEIQLNSKFNENDYWVKTEDQKKLESDQILAKNYFKNILVFNSQYGIINGKDLLDQNSFSATILFNNFERTADPDVFIKKDEMILENFNSTKNFSLLTTNSKNTLKNHNDKEICYINNIIEKCEDKKNIVTYKAQEIIDIGQTINNLNHYFKTNNFSL